MHFSAAPDLQTHVKNLWCPIPRNWEAKSAETGFQLDQTMSSRLQTAAKFWNTASEKLGADNCLLFVVFRRIGNFATNIFVTKRETALETVKVLYTTQNFMEVCEQTSRHIRK